jgi:hypothetical protein
VLGIAHRKWKKYVVLEGSNVAADFLVPVVMEGSLSLEVRSLTLLALLQMWTTMDVAGSKLGREPMDTFVVSQLVEEAWNATKWAAAVMDL